MNTFKLLRMDQARSIINRGKSQFYSDIKAGLLPSPIKVGERTVSWVEGEIRQVAAARIAGFDDLKIKALVSDLIKQRAQLAPVLGGAD
jgi:prophage regulatory protein